MKTAYQLKRLSNEIGFLIQNWGIFWVYQTMRERQKYIHVMNEYPDFFKVGIRAHMHELIIGLYKIWDTNLGNVNINRLVKEMKADGSISKITEKKVSQIRKKQSKTIQKVIILRSNVFAHFSSGLTFEQAFNRVKLEYREMRQLIFDTYGLIYRCSIDLERATIPNYRSYDTISVTRRLLDNLKRNMDSEVV